ncbi:uncharacterized protein LOC106645014 [Copidosoma floridanum]|uniref:uncharacterized protein LOC106645014 n=1 Tax=Copidosoma floridanum TaxID=29053 RepID=UPI0006C9A332|nr:uncharacterized protein LOC106645014 [Copidosoma floridanum]
MRQGCLLSPDVFNLTLEVMLRTILATGKGYMLKGRRYSSLFYVDDGVLVVGSPAGMERQLRAAEESAAAIGITFKIGKCATLHVVGGSNGGAQPSVFELQGARMPALDSTDAYDHLGIPTGYQVRQTLISNIKDLIEDAEKVGESLLAPWQKLDVVGTLLLPHLDFAVQGASVEKECLRVADREVQRLAKT